MATLTTAGRKSLPSSDFALPGRRYPINDLAHARDALARVAQNGTPAEKAAVQRAVHRRFPQIGAPRHDLAHQVHKQRMAEDGR